MANDGDGGLPAGGGNRSLEELRISQTILGRKLDSISNDLRRASDTLRVVTENLRIREDRAPPVRRAYVSPMGARGQRRARRHVQPAPPEFSESDEEEIHHRRYRGCDSSSDEEVEQRILGEPRFAAQPRYLHHLQPPSPSFSSHHHLHTVDHIHTKPMTSLLCNKPITKYISNPPHPSPSTHSRTHSHIPNQFQSHHTLETHKTPNPKFDNTHENQFKTTETCSRFSPETHPPSQFRDQQNAINPICETQSIETHLQPQNSASTHDPCKKNQISQRRVLVDLDLHSSKEDYKSVAPLDSKNRQQHFDLSNSENKLQTKAIMNENGGGCYSQLQFSAAASRVCEVNTSKQNNILVCDFTDTISRCSAPNYSVISQMGQAHENLVGTNSNSKPSVPRIKVTEIEGEDEPLSPVKLVVSSDCGELIGVENGGLSDSEVTVWVKDSANEDDGNAVAVTQGAQFESFVEANENVLEVVNDTNILITDYAQNKDLVEVQRLFEKAPVRDVFTWTAMVSGYIHNGMVDEARRTFDAMPEKNTVSWNAMLVGYVQSKKMGMARELFEAMTCRNVGSWNTMITGYAQSGEITLARNLFDRSPLDTIACDNVRFAEPVNDKIVLSILENFIRPLVDDKIVLSVLIGQIVSTPGFGFENIKTKGVRRRLWQIAWSSSAFRWTIVLVPLWVWDELRRDFSVGVYHSHKPNMGLAPLSFN